MSAPVRRSRLRHPLLVGIAAAVVGALITGVFTLLQPDRELFLISVDQTVAFPFVPGTNDPETPQPDISIAHPQTPVPPGSRPIGTDPGVHGRSGKGVSCNVEPILRYLTDPAHARQAEAWAGVIGIATDAVKSYVDKLTPVRLRYDTRVTNYDYRDGEATGYQSVLQAGTAVLVDSTGMPRMKCNCGNPLAEPDGAADPTGDVADAVRNPQDAWASFRLETMVRVEAGPPAKDFVLMDLDNGGLFRRTAGLSGQDTPVRRGDRACGRLAASTSCGGPGPDLTDGDVQALERAVRRLGDAVRSGDCGTLVAALSTRALARIGLDRASLQANCRQTFDLFAAAGGVTITSIRVVSHRGAQATVASTGTIAGQPFSGEDHLVRENGNWKIDIPA